MSTGTTLRRPIKLLDFDALNEKLGGKGFTREHLWSLEQAGRWPSRLHLSGGDRGHIRWIEEEVDTHIERMAAERRAAKAAEKAAHNQTEENKGE